MFVLSPFIQTGNWIITAVVRGLRQCWSASSYTPISNRPVGFQVTTPPSGRSCPPVSPGRFLPPCIPVHTKQNNRRCFLMRPALPWCSAFAAWSAYTKVNSTHRRAMLHFFPWIYPARPNVIRRMCADTGNVHPAELFFRQLTAITALYRMVYSVKLCQ